MYIIVCVRVRVSIHQHIGEPDLPQKTQHMKTSYLHGAEVITAVKVASSKQQYP